MENLVKFNIACVKAKSIIIKSKLPDTDYVINPYIGCQFACKYCYASFMGHSVNETVSSWGKYIYIKDNAVELFAKEIKSLLKKSPIPKLLLSSVTDPYNYVEFKYQITRKILSVLLDNNYSGLVSILTKSPLVLRDIDLFKQLNNIEVGLTITTTDNKITRMLEKNAPLVSKRLEALEELKNNGIKTYAFVGPLLPHFRYKPELLDALFKKLADIKVDSIFIEHINLNSYIKKRLVQELKDQPKEYIESYNVAHKQVLDSMIQTLLDKYKLKLRLNTVIEHKK